MLDVTVLITLTKLFFNSFLCFFPETDEPFILNDYIRPACLPKQDETPFPFEQCTVFG